MATLRLIGGVECQLHLTLRQRQGETIEGSLLRVCFQMKSQGFHIQTRLFPKRYALQVKVDGIGTQSVQYEVGADVVEVNMVGIKTCRHMRLIELVVDKTPPTDYERTYLQVYRTRGFAVIGREGIDDKLRIQRGIR